MQRHDPGSPGAGAVWIAVERQGERWTVKADTLTALHHVIGPAVYDAVRTVVTV